MFEDDDELNELMDSAGYDEMDAAHLFHEFLTKKKLIGQFKIFVKAEIAKSEEGENTESEEIDEDAEGAEEVED